MSRYKEQKNCFLFKWNFLVVRFVALPAQIKMKMGTQTVYLNLLQINFIVSWFKPKDNSTKNQTDQLFKGETLRCRCKGYHCVKYAITGSIEKFFFILDYS
jgi:hypothetical protein